MTNISSVNPTNIKKFRNYIQHNVFVKNVATLLAGNISAQVIVFLAAPVITRLYSPKDFGTMTLISSYIGVLSVVSCLKYESAIVLSKDDREAHNVFVLCLVISSFFTVFLIFTVAIFKESLALLMNEPGVIKWLWFIPVGVFIYGWRQSLVFWMTRIKNFSLLSFSQFIIPVTSASYKISAGFIIGPFAFWLITGNILGPLVAVALLGGIFVKENIAVFVKNISKNEILHAAKKFKKFPKYNTWSALLNSFSQNLPIFLFAYYFSHEIVGYYGLANSILRRPIAVMAESMSKVFLQKAAETEIKGQSLRKQWEKATLGLAAIGIVPFGALMIGGEWIFSFVFGEKWAAAGFYAQILSPWLFLLFINPPSTQILLVKQKMKFILYYNIGSTLFRLLAIMLSYRLFKQPWVAILFFSATGVIVNIYYMTFAYTSTKELNK